MIRLLILRVIVITGYLPTLALLWLVGGPDWRQEHRETMVRMWRGGNR